jgi:hypothetical protein
MKTGVGLAVIAIGAIFAFAVTTNTSVLNLHTVGWVLMIVGIIGLAIPRRGYGWVGRRLFVRQARWRPGRRIEEITYPTSVNRNPANTRVQAGLPTTGAPSGSERTTLLDGEPVTSDLSTEPRPGETEIVEDIYEN